jgi:O-6-methylguanine DNA methyltransferase
MSLQCNTIEGFRSAQPSIIASRLRLYVYAAAGCSPRWLRWLLGEPNAQRAVGSAIDRNPIAYLIPCQCVIRSLSVVGNYRWGNVRKQAMIGWEASRFTTT